MRSILLLRLAVGVAVLAAAGSAAAQRINYGSPTTSAAALTTGTLPLPRGGTGQSAASAQALAYALKLPYVIAQSGSAVTNTAIGTSEVSMASVAIPALGPNDALRITILWDTTGSTATNTKTMNIRLATSGCTPLAACSTGSSLLGITFNTSSFVSGSTITIIRNAGATNAQVAHPAAGISGVGNAASAFATAAVQTNAGGFLNINSTTATSSADTVKLVGYTIELIPG